LLTRAPQELPNPVCVKLSPQILTWPSASFCNKVSLNTIKVKIV